MWYNAIMKFLLRSPFHGLISKSIMLITYRGRRSGKNFSTPVNFIRDGNTLLVISNRERKWWRNMRKPLEVDLLIAGKEVRAVAVAVEDQEGLEAGFTRLLKAAPQYSRYFKVPQDCDGNPEPGSLSPIIESRVLVEFKLLDS